MVLNKIKQILRDNPFAGSSSESETAPASSQPTALDVTPLPKSREDFTELHKMRIEEMMHKLIGLVDFAAAGSLGINTSITEEMYKRRNDPNYQVDPRLEQHIGSTGSVSLRYVNVGGREGCGLTFFVDRRGPFGFTVETPEHTVAIRSESFGKEAAYGEVSISRINHDSEGENGVTIKPFKHGTVPLSVELKTGILLAEVPYLNPDRDGNVFLEDGQIFSVSMTDHRSNATYRFKRNGDLESVNQYGIDATLNCSVNQADSSLQIALPYHTALRPEISFPLQQNLYKTIEAVLSGTQTITDSPLKGPVV